MIKEELVELLGGHDIQAYTSKCEDHAREGSLEHRIGAARMVVSTDRTNGKKRALDLLTEDSLWEGKGVTIVAVAEALNVRIFVIIYIDVHAYIYVSHLFISFYPSFFIFFICLISMLICFIFYLCFRFYFY